MAGIGDIAKGAVGQGMQGIGSLARFIMAAREKRQAQKGLDNLERPVYSRPKEVAQLGMMSAMNYIDPNLPGQQFLEENIGKNTAQGLQGLKEFGGVADVMGVQANANQATNQLGLERANQQRTSQLQFMDTLKLLGDYSNQEWDYNTNIPFQEKQRELKAQLAQGKQGLWNTFGELMKQGASIAGGDADAVGGQTTDYTDAANVLSGMGKQETPSAKQVPTSPIGSFGSMFGGEKPQGMGVFGQGSSIPTFGGGTQSGKGGLGMLANIGSFF